MTIEVPNMRDEMAWLYADRVLYASLHVDHPGDSGSNEDTGIPRVPVVWNWGDYPGNLITDSMIFSVPSPQYYTHVGFWDSDTGGNFRDFIEINADLPEGDYVIAMTYTQE